MSDPIKNRYEFVVLFDVENGNPNGDPDAGNMPRVDPETGYGLVTDVCLKRKIRNYVEMAKEGEKGYRIYIKDGVPLNSSDKEACAYVGADPDKLKEAKKKDEHLDEKIRDFMCSNFYDIRTFGAVMTTFTKGALNCGQVRGPVQLGFARSIDPILPQEVTITRVAITTEADAEKKNTEMGRKYIVPYGLYRAEGYVSANLARKTTGFSEEDLELLWTAILNMFENDHSAARGKMAVRELIVFKHNCELGCAPAHKLFDLIYIKDGVPLNSSDKEACAYVGADPDKLKEAKKKDEHLDEKIRDFMCSNFYDIRTFGAVMTTFTKGALNCGQVRGPVQLGFARSIDPILPQEVTITRVAITTEADAEKKNTEMGRKYIVPYGLYRAEGYVSANLARKTTGFSEEDLELLWTAILNMFENDHSAARGKMAVRELIVFKHNCELGCAPAHKLFDLVKVEHKDGVTAPRSYGDYTVSVDETHLPSGVTCTRMG